MTGIVCAICKNKNATQALRSGVYCVKCYTDMTKGVTND
jgi:hypothetical protein